MRGATFILLFLTIAGSALCQQIGEPVTISTLVGDTLYQSERSRFEFFPSLNGFKWAVFFLSGDSIVNVRVCYDNDRGISSDTVIVNYGTIRSVHARIGKVDTLSADSAKVVLKDGTLISGTVLGQTVTKLIVLAANLGQLVIPAGQVRSIERRREGPMGRYFSLFSDPNKTRTFLMPTANTIPAGTGYVGDYELLLATAAVGVTDWLMINAGTVLVPVELKQEVINYGFKARVYEVPDKVCLSLGLQMVTPFISDESLGMAYAVASTGNSDAKATVFLGNGFSTHGGSQFTLGLSGDARVSESIKLLAEFYMIQDLDTPPLIVGVRFFGDRLSGDVGLLYLIGGDLGSPIGIPVANLVYNF